MFQVSVGDIQVKTVLSNYARQDRGYNSSAFIYDRELDAYGNTRHNFEQAFGGAGLTVKGVETFAAGDTDMGGQIASLQSGAPQVVYIDGYADDAATVVMGLADKNAPRVPTGTPTSSARCVTSTSSGPIRPARRPWWGRRRRGPSAGSPSCPATTSASG
jgi:ABC-type branched-subunit amino acid transport system substrate-binding protein